MPTSPSRQRQSTLICLALAVVTIALYWPVTRHDFIDFDDNEYISDNPVVKAGPTWDGVVWAFTGAHAGNWHPVTWISHMIDCRLFGVKPGAHHLVNVLFHAANAVLLFALFRYTTGTLWRSAFVAALFAWHPLRVESVAWAAERKDVLSAFFWLLTLLAYARYARGVRGDPSVNPSSAPRRAWLFYGLALVFFSLGLLSKPMVVTLPFVLLLLDVWPLQRWPARAEIGRNTSLWRAGSRLFVEKLPFFGLSLAGSVATYVAQKSSGAVSPVELSIRLMNMSLAYPRYIGKLFWPSNLAIIYPYRYDWPAAAIAGAWLLLLAVSVLALHSWRRTPWLLVGWFWFLGTLIPVIGLVQVGAASIADRYTYLPGIGLAIVIAWLAETWSARRPASTKWIALAGALSLAACLLTTAAQIGYWQNSFSLFLHTIEVTRNNYVADNCLGKAFEQAGQNARALVLYRDAVQIEPRYAVSQFNLATTLLSFGQRDEAFEHFKAAAALEPRNPDFQYDLGVFLAQSGQPAAAVDCFNAALQNRPELTAARVHLAEALTKLGRFAEAATQLREALRLNPDAPGAKPDLQQLLVNHPELGQSQTPQ